MINDFKEFCIKQHNIVCNQKYDNTLPYSFHLDIVANHANKFSYLLKNDDVQIVIDGAWGHDLIEDARVSYNKIVQLAGKQVADIIFACTEEKGRTREERHSHTNLIELSKNRLAIYVKLCDIMANSKYSLLTNDDRLIKRKEEFKRYKDYIYLDEFKEMFNYINKIYSFV